MNIQQFVLLLLLLLLQSHSAITAVRSGSDQNLNRIKHFIEPCP
jgi:hypothetical protein